MGYFLEGIMSKFDTDNLSAPHTQRELGTKPAPAVDVSTEAVMRLLDGVTPGPWQAESGHEQQNGQLYWQVTDGRDAIVQNQYCWCQGDHAANARFIAWCREGVPALLADLAAHTQRAEATEAEVARLREALRQIDIGQSAEPDHWKFRVRAREIARAARRKGGAA